MNARQAINVNGIANRLIALRAHLDERVEAYTDEDSKILQRSILELQHIAMDLATEDDQAISC